MKCGIVILNYKDFTTTQRLLEHIKDIPEIDNIVVVDNASPDNSFVRLQKYRSNKIAVIQSGRNGGYSFGNNTGARYLIKNYHPDIIGIANPDTVFDGAFVKRIKEIFAEQPDYAVLTGISLRADGSIIYGNSWDDDSTVSAMYAATMKMLIPGKRLLRLIPGKREVSIEEIQHSSEELSQVWAVGGGGYSLLGQKTSRPSECLTKTFFCTARNLYWPASSTD